MRGSNRILACLGDGPKNLFVTGGTGEETQGRRILQIGRIVYGARWVALAVLGAGLLGFVPPADLANTWTMTLSPAGK
jgi:hypothetical protein